MIWIDQNAFHFKIHSRNADLKKKRFSATPYIYDSWDESIWAIWRISIVTSNSIVSEVVSSIYCIKKMNVFLVGFRKVNNNSFGDVTFFIVLEWYRFNYSKHKTHKFEVDLLNFPSVRIDNTEIPIEKLVQLCYTKFCVQIPIQIWD